MSDSSTTQKIIDKIKESSNVLVTVSSNPSVDELSAALATTLVVNKLDKHATAVFSGDIPPAIEFLNPGKTFENTVDSLRDFIIALDKEKADHLRYKVVDDMVKIFITPYRTTINESDLEFSQGDYNVELVLAIGVKSEQDLDRALESHGRILHDATVAAISLGEPTNLGGIEWTDTSASSYSEMLATLADGLRGGDKKLIDEQIATAFLTGIVAATERFSNDHTSSKTMTVAAQLMAAGANQQLIATKLEDSQTSEAPVLKKSSGDMKDGELNKIPQDDAEVSKEGPQQEAPKSNANSDGTGALLISHEPEGDVDAVSHEVASKKSDAALSRAEEELAKQTREVQSRQQSDAAEAAEAQLADQLSSVAPAASVPSVADLQKDIAAANDDVEMAANEPIVESVLPPVTPPSSLERSHSETESDTPSFGGTLNATAEQAEEDKRKAVEADRNKTILTHGGGTYAAAEPTFQAPLNAATDHSMDEPEVRDIFAENDSTAPTVHAESIQPPKPATPLGPTLADIEQQTHAKHKDARAAIDAALATEPPLTPLEPTAAPSSTAASLPPLPPLPPMPDFSSLPPLPGSDSESSTSVTDTLGDMLPPAPTPVVSPQKPADPSQFRIPGQ